MRLFLPVALTAALLVAVPAHAAEPFSVTVELKDHRFVPDTLTVPADREIEIVVVNRDAATEEFDSDDLRVEKLITPKGKARIRLSPLKPGIYAFAGELHVESAQGRLIVQQQ